MDESAKMADVEKSLPSRVADDAPGEAVSLPIAAYFGRCAPAGHFLSGIAADRAFRPVDVSDVDIDETIKKKESRTMVRDSFL